jgi:hypothetical protein
MATIQSEKFTLGIVESNGTPKTGALVELKIGASTYVMVELGTGKYQIASIPTGKYFVWVDSVNSGESVSVGSGQIPALGNEADVFLIGEASDWKLGTSTEVKTLLSLENVANIAIPDPTGNNGKVLAVTADAYAFADAPDDTSKLSKTEVDPQSVVSEVDFQGVVKLSSLASEAPVKTLGRNALNETIEFDNVDISGKLDSVVAGTNVSIDNTDPLNPIINSSGTTAGVVTRIVLTGDLDPINSPWLQMSNTSGATPEVEQTVVIGNGDTEEYTQKFISGEFTTDGIIQAGYYEMQLMMESSSSNGIFKIDGQFEVVASDGITVLATLADLETGEISLNGNDLTQVQLSSSLLASVPQFATNRIRLTITAEKTSGAGNTTLSLFSGSNYDSFFNIPIAVTTDAVTDDSTVNNGGILTESLNQLKTSVDDLDLQVAYGNSSIPQIETNALLGEVVVKIGADRIDTDVAWAIWNQASGETFSVTGEGDVTAKGMNVQRNLLSESYEVTERGMSLGFPVATTRPTQANKTIAFDIMPNGSPSDFGNNGVAWLDITDTDIKDDGLKQFNTLRMGIGATKADFGVLAYNGDSPKPLNFMYGDATDYFSAGNIGADGTFNWLKDSFFKDNMTLESTTFPTFNLKSDVATGVFQTFNSTLTYDGGLFQNTSRWYNNEGSLVLNSVADDIIFITGGPLISTDVALRINASRNALFSGKILQGGTADSGHGIQGTSSRVDGNGTFGGDVYVNGSDLNFNTSFGVIKSTTSFLQYDAKAFYHQFRIDGLEKFRVTPTGSITTGEAKATNFSLSALNTAPTSSSDTGTTGEIRWDANYMYVCTATNTWKRSAIATW